MRFQLSACADTLFAALPFVERARRIAAAGFAVEFWGWHDRDTVALADDPDITVSTMIGNVVYRDGGCMVHPDGVDAWIAGVRDCLPIAQQLEVRQLILISGSLDDQGHGNHPIAAHPATRWVTAYKALCQVAEIAEQHDLTYNLEPLNIKRDHPGYSIPFFEDAARLLEQVGSPRIRILMDIYHTQIQEGNVVETIRNHADLIGYVHVADVPGRHEPGTGEIDYARIAAELDNSGYHGSVGLEAYPAESDEQALDAFRALFGEP
ncbi:MAG: hydroxypyruvate isomerase [Planctomycetaceae bacterium]|nr:hydroxypyruvate isomerase [Planctomycetaceae bacterium]